MKIFVLALEGVFDTGLTVTLDALSLATSMSARLFGGTPRFDVTTVGVRRKVKTSRGFTIPIEPLKPASKPDWVLVPAIPANSPQALFANLERADVQDAKTHLLKWSAKGTRIGTACVGTFILADTNLLDHHEATTNWSFSPYFRQRFPKVQLDESRMVVPCEIGVTAGAAMGHLDLVLWIIRQASPELAVAVSRYLTVDTRTSQAPYIIPTHLAQSDPMILRFERWARANLKGGFSLQDASKALATSPRTLQRRCDTVLGKSPLAYFQDLRVEHAQSLLHQDGRDVEDVAAAVGYADGATLRTLLRTRLGRGVKEIRAGF
jgi:transcriptional regulator GlxA family with amidase domain